MPHLILTSLFILLLFQAPAFAVMGPQGVSKTAHNLSSQDGGTLDYYVSDNEDEICIFCHTPHGGSLDGPLWNRSSPDNASFTHYTTTATEQQYNLGKERKAGKIYSWRKITCCDRQGIICCRRSG